MLNGFDNKDNTFLKLGTSIGQVLSDTGFEWEEIDLVNRNIKKCRGCFGCWVLTPGECVVKDDSQAICRLFINSDLVIFLTPVVYGGYSSVLKKMIDKIIPLISPFFNQYSGETHHYPRYKKYPKLLGIGIQNYPDQEEEKCFKNIIYRNSLNFHSPHADSTVISIKEDELSFKGEVLNLINKSL